MPQAQMTAEQRAAMTWDDFQRSVPFDKFCYDTLTNGLNDRAAMMISNYGERTSGLTGKVQQLYRVLFFSMQAGPAAPRADQD
jgi:hypothetical protein